MPHIIHNYDIRLRNAGNIIAASLESEYIGLVRWGHYLARPGESIFVGANDFFDNDISHQGFFCHSCPHVFRVLRFVLLLDIGIATLCRGNWDHCLFDDEAHIPLQSA